MRAATDPIIKMQQASRSAAIIGTPSAFPVVFWRRNMRTATDPIIKDQQKSRCAAITGTPSAFPVRFLEAKYARSN